VVMAGGVFGTAQLLMLSGIGPADHLRGMGLPVVVDRQAVGGNLQDHLDYVASMETKSRVFLGQTLAGTANSLAELIRWFRRREGSFTTPYAEGGAFLKLVKEKMKLVHMDPALVSRSLNDGFSGGQKKRNEVLQMLLLEPELALLDETDSGLDIDALRDCAEGVNTLRAPERGFVVVTHYQRLLDYIQPDFVHVLYKGRIIHSGGKELALELEEKGYEWLTAGVQ